MPVLTCGTCSLPAPAAGLQQAPAPCGAADPALHPGPGRKYQRLIDVWVADSTPVECGRSRETAKGSDLGGWAEIRVLRHPLALLLGPAAVPGRLPVAFALSGAKADERQVLLAIFGADRTGSRNGPARPSSRTRTTTGLSSRPPFPGLAHGCCALPAKESPDPPALPCSSRYARSSSQSTRHSKENPASNATTATPAGFTVRFLQRILVLTAVVWHNVLTGQPALHSLMGYDHCSPWN
jgi:hypothetical protein